MDANPHATRPPSIVVDEKDGALLARFFDSVTGSPLRRTGA